MAIIMGPRGGHATLTGTSGSDVITAYGGYNTITGGGGDDTVLAGSGGFASVTFGAPGDGLTSSSDRVALFGAGNMLTSGDENILASGHVSGSTFDLGNGSNFVDVDGAGNTVVVGKGANTVVALGGNASVTIGGQGLTFGPDQVEVSGTNNTVENRVSTGAYPASGTMDITGGSGNGSFSLGYASGDVITGGTNNTISGGSGTIVAGSGFDRVSAGGQSVDVRIAGLGNTADVTATDATVSGGSGDGTFNLSGQYIGGPALASNGPPGLITLNTGGLDNTVSLFDGNYRIDPGSGADTVTALISQASISFHGSNDELVLQYGNTITVHDHSSGLVVMTSSMFGDVGSLTLDDFDRSGVVDFGRSGGFTSVAEILQDLEQTGPGSYTLATLDHTGTITFHDAGTLTAHNFML